MTSRTTGLRSGGSDPMTMPPSRASSASRDLRRIVDVQVEDRLPLLDRVAFLRHAHDPGDRAHRIFLAGPPCAQPPCGNAHCERVEPSDVPAPLRHGPRGAVSLRAAPRRHRRPARSPSRGTSRARSRRRGARPDRRRRRPARPSRRRARASPRPGRRGPRRVPRARRPTRSPRSRCRQRARAPCPSP